MPIPLHSSLREVKQKWKLQQEIEKRGPVVMWALLGLLLFPLNMPVVRIHQMCVCVCVSCRIILTVLEGKILVRHVLQLY